MGCAYCHHEDWLIAIISRYCTNIAVLYPTDQGNVDVNYVDCVDIISKYFEHFIEGYDQACQLELHLEQFFITVTSIPSQTKHKGNAL